MEQETHMNNKGSGLTPAQALDKLDALYEQSNILQVANYLMKTPANKVFLSIHH